MLTNYHVVQEEPVVDVSFPQYDAHGRLIAEKVYYERQRAAKQNTWPGRVVFRDETRDLALVQLDGLPARAGALKLAARSPSPGQGVHSVGNPGASDGLWVYTAGRVRSVHDKKWVSAAGRQKFYHAARVIETDSPANQATAGGRWPMTRASWSA